MTWWLPATLVAWLIWPPSACLETHLMDLLAHKGRGGGRTHNADLLAHRGRGVAHKGIRGGGHTHNADLLAHNKGRGVAHKGRGVADNGS